MPTPKYRSKFEQRIAAGLDHAGVPYQYEPCKIPFIEPAKTRTYLPDLLLDNGIFVELKGLWTVADRQKALLLRDQHKDKDIRYVFMKASTSIRKGSKTTYGDWATANSLTWADGSIPQAWLDEPQRPEH